METFPAVELVVVDPADRPPVHRALDLLTGALLDVQMRRRRAEAGGVGTDEDLARLERQLRALGACLLDLRDGPARGGA